MITHNLVDQAQVADAATFSHIPIIDLASISSNDPTIKKELAGQIRDVCLNVGFFYVKNHTISESVIQSALDALRKFFDLPMETKMEIENKKSPNFKGYSPFLSGNSDPTHDGDMHEGFEFGWEKLDDDHSNLEDDHEMAGGNVWPKEVPDLRKAALKYYHDALRLGKLLFPLFALALDLPENYFDDKTKHSAALMRPLHYPPQTGAYNEKVIGIGAHTDWECFTILYQEPRIQALQVLNTKNEWINAPPIDGTLVINLGDQFARWTNGIFKSTMHRAINRSGVGRYAIPLFFGTDYDVLLEPIPSCVSESRPARYDVVTAGEYVKQKFKATYGH